ncbi:MAG: endonuclease domain-containing protein [Actinomycetota bacterium]|nr:endonuclease domain-containing protein [Actinomycetota bacterium]
MAEPELAALAARQEGLVTRPQARDHLTREQLKHRLAIGRLEAVRWGVYRFAGAPTTLWQELRAACLAAGPAAVGSHRSAALLWGLWPGALEPLEITVPWPQWPRLPGVRPHQSTRLPVDHCTTRHGVPVTTAARTIADLSSIVPAQALGRLTDTCLRQGLFPLGELHAVHRVLAGPGRHGLAALAEVLERRPVGYRPGGSGAELDLLAVLESAGLPRPVHQHQVVIRGSIYVLDFAYPDLKIGIEYDGWAFHNLPSDLDRAARRGNALELAGWTMLHFTEATGPSRIVADVAAARGRALRAVGAHDLHLRGIEH